MLCGDTEMVVTQLKRFNLVNVGDTMNTNERERCYGADD